MEPTQANPVRKRRRWLIVAFGLVLVSGVVWWYWPRGDARFVGTWAIHPYASRTASGTLVLTTNGMAVWSGPAGNRVLGGWRVEDQHVFIGMFDQQDEGPVRRRINEALFRWTKTRLSTFEGRWKITRVDSQSFDAIMDGALTSRKSALTTFRRVSE